MAFEKIIEKQKASVPQYKVELKETGKTIFIKPFFVKDYKRLLTINHNDAEEIKKNLFELIKQSTEIDPRDLTINDFIYLVVSLAEVSLGETIQAEIKCQKCGASIPIQISKNDIDYENLSDKKHVVELQSGIVLFLKPLSIKEIEEIENLSPDKAIIKSIMYSIEQIVYNDEVYNRNEIDEKELMEFVLNITKEDLDKIDNIIKNMPVIKMEKKVVCPACNNEFIFALRGGDFLEFF